MGGRSGISLTPRQARFVREYLVDLNGTQAAIRAGYSAHTAAAQAVRLLMNVNIKTAVKAGAAKRQEKLDLKADDVLKALMAVGYTKLDPSDIRVGDVLRALELLAKNLGLLTEQVKVTIVDELEKRLEVGRQRAAANNAKSRG